MQVVQASQTIIVIDKVVVVVGLPQRVKLLLQMQVLVVLVQHLQ